MPNPEFKFPNDYGKYFDAAGVLKVDYLTDLPERIAETLKHEWPALTMTQLRAFYMHAKRTEEAWRRGVSLGKASALAEAVNEIKRFEYLANDRLKLKKKIPQTFHDFLCKNAKNVNAEDGGKSLKAFLEHFEALVGFCAGRIKERDRT
jgi:hypothetical protein